MLVIDKGKLPATVCNHSRLLSSPMSLAIPMVVNCCQQGSPEWGAKRRMFESRKYISMAKCVYSCMHFCVEHTHSLCCAGIIVNPLHSFTPLLLPQHLLFLTSAVQPAVAEPCQHSPCVCAVQQSHVQEQL